MRSVFKVARQITPTDFCLKYGFKGKRTTMDRGRFCCIFHDDNDPSMATYDESGRFCCFTCNARGDVIDLAKQYYKLPVRDAARRLCQEFGLAYEDRVHNAVMPEQPPKEAELLISFLDDWRRTKEELCYNEWQAAERNREQTLPDDWLWQLYHQKAAHYREQYHIYKQMTRSDVLNDLRKELVALDVIKERKIPIVGFVT